MLIITIKLPTKVSSVLRASPWFAMAEMTTERLKGCEVDKMAGSDTPFLTLLTPPGDSFLSPWFTVCNLKTTQNATAQTVMLNGNQWKLIINILTRFKIKIHFWPFWLFTYVNFDPLCLLPSLSRKWLGRKHIRDRYKEDATFRTRQ